jgi:hypothetical protein
VKVCLPGIFKINTHISTAKAYGFLAIGTRLCAPQDSILKECGCARSGIKTGSSGKIRGLRDKNLPLLCQIRDEKPPKLVLCAPRHFRSWNKALVAAGINKKQASTSVYKSGPDILRALRDVLENSSKDDIAEVLQRGQRITSEVCK